MSYIQYIVMAPDYIVSGRTLCAYVSPTPAQPRARAENRPPLDTKHQENGHFQNSLRDTSKIEARISLMTFIYCNYSAILEKDLILPYAFISVCVVLGYEMKTQPTCSRTTPRNDGTCWLGCFCLRSCVCSLASQNSFPTWGPGHEARLVMFHLRRPREVGNGTGATPVCL